MTAVDGLPFRVFVTSKDLRRGLVAMGLSNVPTSAEAIKQLVMKHGKTIRALITADIDKQKKQGARFSITFDEWTSTRNRHHHPPVIRGTYPFPKFPEIPGNPGNEKFSFPIPGNDEAYPGMNSLGGIKPWLLQQGSNKLTIACFHGCGKIPEDSDAFTILVM